MTNYDSGYKLKRFSKDEIKRALCNYVDYFDDEDELLDSHHTVVIEKDERGGKWLNIYRRAKKLFAN